MIFDSRILLIPAEIPLNSQSYQDDSELCRTPRLVPTYACVQTRLSEYSQKIIKYKI